MVATIKVPAIKKLEYVDNIRRVGAFGKSRK